MEKTWDNSLSTLINSHPQAFLDLLPPGARCLQQHRTKLSETQHQPDAALEVDQKSRMPARFPISFHGWDQYSHKPL